MAFGKNSKFRNTTANVSTTINNSNGKCSEKKGTANNSTEIKSTEIKSTEKYGSEFFVDK